MLEPCSAIMMVGAWVLPDVIKGIIEASITLRFSNPVMVAGIDQIIQEALSHYPDNLWHLYQAGWWYYISGRYQHSMKQLQKGIFQVAMGSDRFKAYSARADSPPTFQMVIDWLHEERSEPG